MNIFFYSFFLKIYSNLDLFLDFEKFGLNMSLKLNFKNEKNLENNKIYINLSKTIFDKKNQQGLFRITYNLFFFAKNLFTTSVYNKNINIFDKIDMLNFFIFYSLFFDFVLFSIKMYLFIYSFNKNKENLNNNKLNINNFLFENNIYIKIFFFFLQKIILFNLKTTNFFFNIVLYFCLIFILLHIFILINYIFTNSILTILPILTTLKIFFLKYFYISSELAIINFFFACNFLFFAYLKSKRDYIYYFFLKRYENFFLSKEKDLCYYID